MREIYRILDANFNRAREALRVAEDCGRFALNDPAITSMAKHMGSDLKQLLDAMPIAEFYASRNTPGDIGTEITSPTEQSRGSISDVAAAACKRLTSSLRTIEEYSKILSPGTTLSIERMRYNAYTLEQRLMSRFLVGERFGSVRLYVLLSTRTCGHSLRDTARAAIAGGADALQLREKHAPDGALLALAAELRELTDETNRMFIMNDRADIAAIVGADGLHLGQEDLPLAEARTLLRPGALIGRSTHSVEQARAAVTEGADYIAVGPVFESRTKDAGAPVGCDLLRRVREAVDLPIVAIGGINEGNLDAVLAAGASCIAVCSSVCCAPDPKAAAQALRRKIDAHNAGK